MDFKEIKKLAAMCRAAGIHSFKCADYEFTLTHEAPVSPYKKRQATKTKQSVTNATINEQFETDSLTEEQLLNWSVRDPSVDEKAE